MTHKLAQGMVQVYTGEGKGKTTCALGLGLRAVGRGFKVFMIQFMKGQDSGELHSLERLAPDFTIRQFGRRGFIKKGQPHPEDLTKAGEALALAQKIITGGVYDLVILDEVNVALHLGLLNLPQVLELIRARPAHVEVVLTGRNAPPEIMAAADLVTEMKNIKHYFAAGVPARPGIES
jgi:cob(I)alamin adenosyltransferase